MRRHVIFATGLLLSGAMCAQQLPFHSQYMYDAFLINPVAAGSGDYMPFLLSYRNQWTGFVDAPQTLTLSGHGSIKDNMGLGAILFSDKTGPTSRTGTSLAYAHHLPLGRGDLSFGLGAMLFQYVLDKGRLDTDPEGGYDPAINTGETVKILLPEATFGLFYRAKNYYAGASVPQLIQMKVNVGGSSTQNKMTRHYFLTAGYLWQFNDKMAIEPSLLLKATAAAPLQVDINSKFHFRDLAWAGVSYRTQESAVVMAGVKKGSFSFGYSYDFTLTNIRKYSSGSHELFIGYHREKKKAGKALI